MGQGIITDDSNSDKGLYEVKLVKATESLKERIDALKKRIEAIEKRGGIIDQIEEVLSAVKDDYYEVEHNFNEAAHALDDVDLKKIDDCLRDPDIDPTDMLNTETLNLSDIVKEVQSLVSRAADITKVWFLVERDLISYKLELANKKATLNYLEKINISTEKVSAWCADMSDGLKEKDIVGTIEHFDGSIQIYPSNVTKENRVESDSEPNDSGDYPTDLTYWELTGTEDDDQGNIYHVARRDGALQPGKAAHPEQAFFNLAVQPGAQKWKPTYRTGVIEEIDHSNDTCKVKLHKAKRKVVGKDVDFNKETELDDVPIEYMSCNAAVFDIDDRVVVKFEGQSWDSPKVVGFVEEPRPCRWIEDFGGPELSAKHDWHVSTLYGENVTYYISNGSLVVEGVVGAGEGANVSFSVFVGGNIGPLFKAKDVKIDISSSISIDNSQITNELTPTYRFNHISIIPFADSEDANKFYVLEGTSEAISGLDYYHEYPEEYVRASENTTISIGLSPGDYFSGLEIYIVFRNNFREAENPDPGLDEVPEGFQMSYRAEFHHIEVYQ